jgi:hypothetical protein
MAVAISLGLLSAIILYLFQQYLFSLFRFLNIGFFYNVDYIISDQNVMRLGIFYAGNAVIIGNSVFVSLMTKSTGSARKVKSYYARIRNNQSFLIGSYYFWAFKITFVILLINLYNQIDFGLVQAMWSLVPFLFVALFLESVKGLRRYWKDYSLKVFALHGLLVSCLILGLSKVNSSVYNRLSTLQEMENPFVHLPVVNNEDGSLFEESYYSYRNVSRVKVLEQADSLEYRFYRVAYSFENLIDKIVEYGHYTDQYRPRISLYVSNNMPYYKLEKLEKRLAYYNINKVFYMTQDTAMGRQIGFRKNLYLTKDMFEDRMDGFPPPPYFYEDRYIGKPKKLIKIDDFLSDSRIDQERLGNYFCRVINKETIFEFQISESTTLQHYIDFMNVYREVVKLLRAEYKTLNLKDSPRTVYPHKYIEVFL